MKRYCIDCHYFHFKGITIGNSNKQEYIDASLSLLSRQEFKEGKSMPLPGGPQRYICADGMWDQDDTINLEVLRKDILGKKRGKNDCHYIYKGFDGATTEAVARIHKEQNQIKYIKINRWISVIVIIISICVPIFQYLVH